MVCILGFLTTIGNVALRIGSLWDNRYIFKLQTAKTVKSASQIKPLTL